MGIAESSHNNILLELMNHVSEMIAETIGESRRIILYGEQNNIRTTYRRASSYI